jgi:hypothetical protein
MSAQPIITKDQFDYLESIYKAEDSFYEFVKQAWPVVSGNKPFYDGWYLQAICEHLEAVLKRQIKNLLVNMPPRHLKSSLISVMWVAWAWIHNPNEQFLCSSYSATISNRDSRYCRRLIESNWYQERWGHLFKLDKDQNTKHRFDNTKQGYRIATSTGGSSTGEGGSILIADDPNNAKDVESDAERETAIDWWDGVWSTRLNNINTDCMVVVQQRLHEKDITGHIIENDYDNDWVKLILPMEFEIDRRAKTIILPSTNGKIWEDPRKNEGEILCQTYYSPKGLERLKKNLKTETRIAGQLQQRPRAADGDLIKREWFQWWKEKKSPEVIQVIQSWDTALSEKKSACYSACTTWGLFYDERDQLNVILLSAYRGRVGYPELRTTAKRLFMDYRDDGHNEIEPDGQHKPDYVLVESKSSGMSLLQDFNAAGIIAFGFDPDKHGDKEARVHVTTHLLQGGRVWVATDYPNTNKLRRSHEEFVESCVSFPGERDYTDSMVQVLIRLMVSRFLRNPDDDQDQDTSKKWNKRIY